MTMQIKRATWHGDKILARLKDRARQATIDLGKELKKDLRESLSIPYPPASFAGEAPHSRTGLLRGSISVTTKGLSIYVRTSVPYALYLEYGTHKMEARPWLRPGIRRMESRVRTYMKQYTRSKRSK